MLPPMVSGALPVVGHLPQFMRDRDAFLKRGQREHGQVFCIRLPNPVVVVGGSQWNRWFYTESNHSLNIGKAYGFLDAALGRGLLTAPKEEYDQQRPILKVIFSNERMRDYLLAMNAEVDHWLASLGDEGEVEISQAMLQLTQNVAGAAFLGPNFRDELGEEFWPAYLDISRSLEPLIPPHWPLPKFRRRDKARATIHRLMRPLCERRRRNPEAYSDALSIFLNTKVLGDELFDEERVVQLWTRLIFAGHETTAGQMAWSVILPLQHPSVQRALEESVRTVPMSEPLGAKELRSLELVYRIVDETARLRPSTGVQMRVTDQPVEIAGYQVPEGVRVMVSSAVSHLLDDKFHEPERFDPERFSPERGEGNDPYALVSFGGGRHKCTGMSFAKNEMAVMLTKLFGQYDVELITKNPEVNYRIGATRPSPTFVRYKKR